MAIRYTRHAKSRMRWRKITANEVESVLAKPEKEETSLGYYHAYRKIGVRFVRVTYLREGEDAIIISVVNKKTI